MRQVAEGVVIPDDIDDAPNGQLDASMLVSFRGQWQLHRFAAPLFEAFFDAAKRELNFDLTLIRGSASAYRTYSRQVAMFYERHQPSDTGNKQFAGRRWRLRSGMANAAVPVGGATLVDGRWIASAGSNHGWGVAADICHVGERALSISDRQRLQPIGHRFGLRWTALPAENWHVAAINAQSSYGLMHPPTTPPVVEPPTPTPITEAPWAPEWGSWGPLPSIEVSLRPDLDKGAGFGDGFDRMWVLYLQGVLRIKCQQSGVSIHGLYDEATALGVLASQIMWRPGMPLDGWGRIGRDDWSWIDYCGALR